MLRAMMVPVMSTWFLIAAAVLGALAVLVPLGFVAWVVARSNRSNFGPTRPSPRPLADDSRWEGSAAPQRVGRACAACNERIVVEAASELCAQCGEVVHRDCASRHAASDGAHALAPFRSASS